MGQCSAAEPQIQNYRTTFTEQVPKKCIILQNPPQILLEIENDVKRISINRIENPNFQINLSYAISDRIFISSQNKLFYIQNFSSAEEPDFQKAIYHYYIQSNLKINGLIELQKPIVVDKIKIMPKFKNFTEKSLLILETKPLCSEEYKFVQIKDLGKKMKEKGILWQDKQFEAIINECLKVMSKVYHEGYYGLEEVIVGSNGRVYMYGKLKKARQNMALIKEDIELIKKQFLQSLYGKNCENYQQQEQKCIFKHPQSLKKLEYLPYYFQEYSKEEAQEIAPSQRKFIKDYIKAYFYRQSVNLDNLLVGYSSLGNLNKAKEILVEQIIIQNHHNSVTEESLKNYQKLVEIQKKINIKSQDCKATEDHTASLAYNLGLKQLNLLNYSKAYEYFEKAQKTSCNNLIQDLYVLLYELSICLGKNEKALYYLNEGIKENSQSNILCFYLIIYYSDCLRVDEAQKVLLKSISHLNPLCFSIASARVNLMKSLTKTYLYQQCLTKAEDEIQRTILKQKEQKDSILVHLYETQGDILLRRKNYSQALSSYEKSKVFLKSSNQVSNLKMCTILSAIGNCYLLMKDYEKAKQFYESALQLIKPECEPVYHGIIGNMAIAELQQSQVEQAQKKMQTIFESLPKHKKQSDVNYVFLLETAKKIKSNLK